MSARSSRLGAAATEGIVLVPYGDAHAAGFGDMGRRVPDTTKLRQLTGWAPVYALDVIIDDVLRASGETVFVG